MDFKTKILDLAAEEFGRVQGIDLDDDFFDHFSVAGQDVTDFMTAYFERFRIDRAGFRWEFHYNADEPPGMRRWFPVDEKGAIIEFRLITLRMLVESAEVREWAFDYPSFDLKRNRMQQALHAILIAAFVGCLILLAL